MRHSSGTSRLPFPCTGPSKGSFVIRRTNHPVRRGITLFAITLALLVAPAFVSSDVAGAVDHPGLVPEDPVTGYPVIVQDGQYDVWAANQIGNFIVSGGDFLEVELQNGQVISQPYFAVWHIDTKELVCADVTFDNEILDIIPGDTPNSMFVAGRFNTITDADGVQHTRRKIAKLHLPDCRVDLDFAVTGTNGKINHLALDGDRLFVAGDYTQLNGQAQSKLAEMSATTGALATFDLGVISTTSSTFRGIGINPAGTRLIAGGRWSSISGVVTGPTAVIDISVPGAPVLTGHRSSGTPVTIDLQDAAISPDGTNIALVYGTATVSDYVVMFSTAESPQTPLWTHFMRDSSFSIAISDEAVYVGGHFCKIDEGPGPTDVMAPKTIDFCTGVFYAGGAWRSQLAALDIATGTPLTWNPGNDAFGGAEELRVTDRGLLVGYDGTRTNGFRVGPTAVFDFGPVGDTLPPSTVTVLSPAQNAQVESPFELRATASDNTAVTTYRYRAQHANGLWLQSDGTLGADPHLFEVAAQPNGDLITMVLAVVDGTYAVEVRAGDAQQNHSLQAATSSVDVMPTPAPECVATISANGAAQLTWDPVAGVDEFQIRRNGSWVATATGTSFATTGVMADTFVVRYWITTPTDIACTNELGDPNPPECLATIQPNGDALIEWDPAGGDPTYQVRRDGSWLASTNDTVFTDTEAAGNGANVYVIRYRIGGVTTDLACETVGGNPPPQCAVTVLAGGGIRLDWDPVPGVTTYQVRKNGSWLATSTALTYTDTDGEPGDSYLLRYWSGGPMELGCA